MGASGWGEGRLAQISSGRFNLVLRGGRDAFARNDEFRLLDHGDLLNSDSGVIMGRRQNRVQTDAERENDRHRDRGDKLLPRHQLNFGIAQMKGGRLVIDQFIVAHVRLHAAELFDHNGLLHELDIDRRRPVGCGVRHLSNGEAAGRFPKENRRQKP